MATFSDLVASRRAWIETDLKPWCLKAPYKDLRLAEEIWVDVAGKVDPEKTLWFWAWSRFDGLVNAELQSIDETRAVTVTLADGRAFTGIPDARQSRQGSLVLLCAAPDADQRNRARFVEQGPFRIDEIAAVSPSSQAGSSPPPRQTPGR